MAVIDFFKNIFTKNAGSKSKTSLPMVDDSIQPRRPVLVKDPSMGNASRDYEQPEFGFDEVDKAYDIEPYVRQAVDKYIELIFKEGWQLVSKNPDAAEYIKKRFNLMALATNIPTEILFIEIAEDLVKYSNAIVVKIRDDNYKFPSNIKVIKLASDLPPVAGYVPVNIKTMTALRDETGVIKAWKQTVGNKEKVFKPRDVIHFYYRRDKGEIFGTPFLLPVIEDIKSLRQIEENVLRLIYRNIFPFLHYKIGDKDRPATDMEINAFKQEIESMALEAGIVTHERCEIKPIALDNIIDAYKYLTYFEDRVFTGLGVPKVLMGRGDTANKSTSDNLTVQMHDKIKAYQKVMSTFINNFMILELLYEGGFDPISNPDDMVYFEFNEIDIDLEIKKQNHAVFLYEHYAITEDEMRRLIKRDPISDDERVRMRYNILADVKVKEPSKKETDNKNQPENQHGKKLSPKKTSTSTSPVLSLKEEIKRYIGQYYTNSENTFTDDIIVDGIKKILDGREDVLPVAKEMVLKYIENVMNEKTLSFTDKLDLIQMFFDDHLSPVEGRCIDIEIAANRIY